MSVTFSGIVHDALGKALKEDTPEAVAAALPGLIRDGLRHGGYEVHAVGSCVRPKFRRGEPTEFGREMTTADMIAVGIAPPEAG